MKKKAMVWRMAGINVAVQLCLAAYFFLIPSVMVIRDVSDPALKTGGIPRAAWRVHHALTGRYESWARRRVASGVAATLDLYDVPSTEWPIFGSVFYLMATESLQEAWEKDNSLSELAPKVYAAGTIEAAKDVVMDLNHHSWVKEHWGENYLHEQNVFFRSLLIGGLKSYQSLTGNREHEEFLKDQCLTLADDLDQSKYGILDDYPGECYPIDIFAAIAIIKDAGEMLELDQSAFITRSVRAFEGDMLDRLGLLPYGIDSLTGRHNEIYESPYTESGFEGPSRGVGNSYFLIFAPSLWPERSEDWYKKYEDNFWQDLWWATGFREFSEGFPNKEWGFDVDAGPIIAGFSPAANAFGYAAAVANGRFDHSYTLGVQTLAACWPMPDGTLLGTKVLSDPEHAPYLGEVNLLWLLTRRPAAGVDVVTGGRMPFFVAMMTLLYASLGVAIVYASLSKFRMIFKDDAPEIKFVWLQFSVWAGHIVASLIVLSLHLVLPSMIILLLAQVFPLVKKEKQKT
jgi:hypothetical protein